MSDTPPNQELSEENTQTLPEVEVEPLGPTGARTAYKFSARKRKEYLDLLREGGRRGKSARAIKVTSQAISEYMRDEAGALTDFGREVLQAEAEADEEVETALYDAAVSGNVTAIQTWLYNRKTHAWQPRTGAQAVAISGSVSQVTEVHLEVSAKQELLGVLDRMAENLTVPIFSPISATSGPSPTPEETEEP